MSLESLSANKCRDIEEHMAMLKGLYPGLQFQKLLKATGFDNIVTEYHIFIETYKATCPTILLWSHYCLLFSVGLMIKFICATRQSDWLLHLSSLRSMIPWFFAADQVNYSRYASVYWLEIRVLDVTHPSINAFSW